jgi:hypothetical protein
VRLRESFDERRILTLEILKHQQRDIAPVDDPAVREPRDRLSVYLSG